MLWEKFLLWKRRIENGSIELLPFFCARQTDPPSVGQPAVAGCEGCSNHFTPGSPAVGK